MAHFRPTVARIDVNALRHNLAVLARQAAPEQLLPVIKADAYGHGAVMVCRALSGFVDTVAVALLDEAVQLRAQGIRENIVVLQGAHCAASLHCAADLRLTLVLENFRQIALLHTLRLPQPVSAWLKVDTGMHRLGFAPEDVDQALGQLLMTGNVRQPVVLATHFASADRPLSPALAKQRQCFAQLRDRWPLPASLNNSAALLLGARHVANWARCGYLLYGGRVRRDEHRCQDQLQAVMQLQTRVIGLREIAAGEAVGYDGSWTAPRRSRIATLPIGYADGYPRHAASGTPVWINGRRAALAGRVSMDLITVDVTDIDGVDYDTPVELWGAHLPVDEVAAHAGTIGYQLLAGLTARVPRQALYHSPADANADADAGTNDRDATRFVRPLSARSGAGTTVACNASGTQQPYI